MEREQIDRIQAWMEEHRAAMEADIMRLVHIPSVSEPGQGEGPFGAACRDALHEMLKIGSEHGFFTRNYDDYCGSMWLDARAENVEDCVGFWGHLDVVPVGEGWIFQPFEPFIRDGLLFGRGSQDNKGPTIATMYIMECLHTLGIPTRYPLRMFFGCDEERGMRDLEYYASRFPCPKLSIIADSGFPVCYGEKGIIEADLEAGHPFSQEVVSFSGGTASNMVPASATIRLLVREGRDEALRTVPGLTVEREKGTLAVSAQGLARHPAFPEGGRSAVCTLVRGVLAAEVLPEEDEEILLFFCRAYLGWYGRGLGITAQDELSGRLTCVGSVCGIGENGNPFLHVNIRYPITADSDALLQAARDTCAAHGFAFHLRRSSAPNNFPRTHPAVDALTAVYNEMAGDHAEPFVMGGGTYARKLPHAFAFRMGLPGDSVHHELLPPGHGSAHEPDEVLKLESLWKAMNIFAASLLALNDLDF